MILSFAIECRSLNEFLDHWSAKYRDPRDRDKYDTLVGRLPLTEDARLHLFEWKNGSILSAYKLADNSARISILKPELDHRGGSSR